MPRLMPLPAALLALLTSPAPAAGFDEGLALRMSQQVIGHEVRDLSFVASNGERMRLADLRGQPVVISMIYTSCAGICPATTRQLSAAVRVARGAVGPGGFTVLSVGFDTTHDTPQALHDFAVTQHITDPRWHFVTASRDDIAQLAADTGFWFAPGAGLFEHLVQTTLLDGRGRVALQLYGNEFRPLDLAEPLRKAVLGAPRAAGLVLSSSGRVRVLCTVYDARLGRYRADYTLALSILIAASALIVLLVIVARAWRFGGRRGAA